MKLYLFLIFVILITVVIGQDESTSNNNQNNNLTIIMTSNPTLTMIESKTVSNKFSNIYSSIPRIDFHGNRVNATVVFSNATDDDIKSYIESITIATSPFLFLTSITIVMVVITGIGSLIYYTLIKPRQTKKRLNNNDYQELSYRIKIIPLCYGQIYTSIIIFLFTLIFGILLVSIFANNDMDKSIKLALNTMQDTLSFQVEVEERIVIETKDLGLYYRMPRDALQMFNLTSNMYNLTSTNRSTILHFENIRYNFIFSTILVMFGIVSLGLFAVLFKFRRVIVAFVAIGLVMSIAVWTIPSTHMPLGIVVSDVCPQITNLIEKKSNDLYPYVQYFLECQNSHIFDFVDFLITGAINQTQISLNNAINRHYPQSTIDHLKERLNELLSLRDDSNTILDCNTTYDTYESLQNMICIEILNESSILTTLFMSIGLLFCFSLIFSIKLYDTIDPFGHAFDSETEDYTPLGILDAIETYPRKLKRIFKKQQTEKQRLLINGDPADDQDEEENGEEEEGSSSSSSKYNL